MLFFLIHAILLRIKVLDNQYDLYLLIHFLLLYRHFLYLPIRRLLVLYGNFFVIHRQVPTFNIKKIHILVQMHEYFLNLNKQLYSYLRCSSQTPAVFCKVCRNKTYSIKRKLTLEINYVIYYAIVYLPE